MKNMLALYFISVFECTTLPGNIYKIQVPVFQFILFLHRLIQQQLSFFNKILELHSILSEKIFLLHIFLCSQIHFCLKSTNCEKFFCQCSISKLLGFYLTLIWRPVWGRVRVFKLEDNLFMRNVNINYLFLLPLTK